MTEDIFTNNVSRIEKIYSILIKGESNPQQEVEMRIELIDSLSNLEASLISEKEHNQEFITLLVQLRESLLSWDPYGQWFRQQKNLVDAVYEVIVKAKNVVFAKEKQASSEATRLKKELSSLKTELSDLRSLMSSLIKEKSVSIPETSPSKPVAPFVQPTEPVESAVPEDVSTKPTSRLPWKQKEDEIIPDSTSEPPIMTPLITPKETQEPVVSEKIEEEETLVSDLTIEKITQSTEAKSSSVLGQMKSLITEAEKETEKQMTDFKEQFKSTITPPSVEESTTQKSKQTIPSIVQEDQVAETKITTSEESSDSWVKPSEILKQKEEKESSTPAVDPYMQLLTLEAEKYRLEKDIEKNETEFQEGLKSKKEFDEMINSINKELAIVREQIDELRTQLTS
ncbi:MAG: hypothetical protein FK730_09060 [Asgard group archaeon]|nr:hypothetical protein [Asgard group archaeon]